MKTGLLVLAMSLLAAAAESQQPSANAAPSAEAACVPVEKPKPSDADGVVPGFRYGTPQKLSAYSGGAWAVGITPTCIDYRTLTLDLGMGGSQLSAGYAVMSRRVGSLRIQESLLRTWGRPWKATPNSWYVGTELQWTYVVGLRVGRFHQVGGPSTSERTLTVFSVVVGF